MVIRSWSLLVATGAVLGMLGLDTSIFLDILQDSFGKKGESVVSANAKAAKAGHEFAGRECLRCEFSASAIGDKKMLIGINEAVGLGALASGCKFYSAYPMTPSTGIMLYIAGKAKEYGVIVEQAEDEIAAINMALGASFAGVRAMTGSSGGGFALMVEGLSLAAITETPIVIACPEAWSCNGTSDQNRTGRPSLCSSCRPWRVSTGHICSRYTGASILSYK